LIRQSWFTVLLALMLAAVSSASAKVRTMDRIEKLPEKEDEAELWERAREHEEGLREAGTVASHPRIEKFLEAMADRMLGDFLDHLGVEVRFIIVEEPTLSAWAYPYGTIGIHTGLLVRMDNEAQLGSIVAHELSHFLQRHTYREMLSKGKQSVFGKGLGLLAGAALAKQTGSFSPDVADFTSGLWLNLATSGYSKKNEYVADEEGLMLMAGAGMAREEAIPAFEALAENDVYGAGDPRKIWSSHPRLENRLKNLKKEIRREKRRKGYVAGGVPDRLDYYRAIATALIANAKLDTGERQFGRAREALEKYLLVYPEDPEAHFLVGEAHRLENPMGPEFTEAMKAWHAALEHDPAYADAYRELGMAYRMQRKNTEARSAFERYLAIAPGAPDAGIIRGYIEGLK